VIGTASSFNATLWHAIAAAVSVEMRAFSNAGHAGVTAWAPNLNIFRDPRWGRGQETPGEDPVLNGAYSSAYVRGMQGAPLTGPAAVQELAVSACCKHFDAYSLENWGGVQRYSFDAVVNAQDLADTYLPAFRACVVDGGSSCIMCSYNAVNGVPMCANKPFITDLARGAWAFDGYVTSDCDAVYNIYSTHNYTTTLTEAVSLALQAGVDLDCGESFDFITLQLAISRREVTSTEINTALRRLLRVQFRLGLFDPAAGQPLRKLRPSAIGTPEHSQLALEAARQSLVLLKNDGDVLPLPRPRAGAAQPVIAIIGPHGDATGAMQGDYWGPAKKLISPLAGVQAFYPGATFAPGCLDVLCPNTSGFAAALSLAAQADVVLLFAGLSLAVENEGLDRVNLTLPGMQAALISAVLQAAQPTATVVLTLLSGGCVDIGTLQSDPRLPAVLWAGYPGQSGGTAIAEALFGLHSPSGRLTQSWYPQGFADSVSMFDMTMRPNASSGSPGRSYRFYNSSGSAQQPLLYPFGFGLSYTSFSLAWAGERAVQGATVPLTQISALLPQLRVEASASSAQSLPALLSASVAVTNSGRRPASRTLIAFLSPPPSAASLGAPQSFLVWFGRTAVLKPGATQTLSFSLTAKELSFVAPDGSPACAPGGWTLAVDELDAAFTVSGDAVVTAGPDTSAAASVFPPSASTETPGAG
jgi:beta-glucosidase-like glycosyl hydrolase